LTKTKALTASIILFAAIATPVFAQDVRVPGPTHHARSYNQQNFRGAYAAPLTGDEYRTLENLGFSGRDPSRVGGEDADLNGGSGN
jgi:hypothetical protein